MPAEDAEADLRTTAEGVWAGWSRGASDHSRGARVACLAVFGRYAWGIEEPISVISRVIAAIREDSAAFRTLARQWIEDLRGEGRSIATLRQRWRTLAALLGVLEQRTGELAPRLGALPLPAPADAVTIAEAFELAARLAEERRERDAAILALLADGVLDRRRMGEAAVLALRVRDVSLVAVDARARPWLAACVAGQRPQAFVFRGPRGRALSRAALYDVARNAGLTLSALASAS